MILFQCYCISLFWARLIKQSQTNSNLSSLIGVECPCDFGANLVQHYMRRYSRCSRNHTKTHDKATISHEFPRYSRHQTVLSKLQEISSALRRLSTNTRNHYDFGCSFFLSTTILPQILFCIKEGREYGFLHSYFNI